MNTFVLSVLIGLVAGTVDALPMMIKKLSKHACLSAFLQYIVVSIVIINIDIPFLPWWIKGGVVALMMAIPIVVLVAESDKKSVPIILANSIVLGTLIGIAGHYLI